MIYSSIYEKSIGIHQAIDEVKIDNDGSSNEYSIGCYQAMDDVKSDIDSLSSV